jgi:hypothetical protein
MEVLYYYVTIVINFEKCVPRAYFQNFLAHGITLRMPGRDLKE